MRYYYRLWGNCFFELRLKPYYTLFKKILINISYKKHFDFNIFCGHKFKVGDSKK